MRTWVVVALALVACEGKAKQKAPPPPTLPKAPLPEVLPEGADMTFPTDPPVIQTRSSGGFDGGNHGGIEVWADGSVRWTLDKCAAAARRGKLSPTRVTELLAGLDKAGVYAPVKERTHEGCCECVHSSFTVRSGDKTATLNENSCDRGEESPAFTAATALLADVVGEGPCAYPPPPTDEEMRRAIEESEKKH